MRQAFADSAQVELNRIEGWCEDNNGKLHSGKAAALWCSLNNRAIKDDLPKVHIAGKEIGRVHILLYLGLLFDRTHGVRTFQKPLRGQEKGYWP